MKLPLNELQAAIVSALSTAYPTWRIFDDTPEQPKYPYVIVGEVSTTDWRTKSEPGVALVLTLHFWSQYPGKHEAAGMMGNALTVLLRDHPPALPNLSPTFHVVDLALDSAEIIIDVDGYTRHGLLRLRYLIEEVG
jgi:hypothetical protein